MKVIQTIQAMRAHLRAVRAQGKTVGLVPTMGALHAGHVSLIDAARSACDCVIVTIFVNPTQFGPAEDLGAYPRTPEADLEACRAHGADAVFMPGVAEMYPPEALTDVRVRAISERLCGRDRPVHFGGVCTVVAKLFNIVPADKAFFGQKDFQQTVVIKRMAADLNFPVEVVVCPTVREPDGLAMSSRNVYLTPEQRRQAPALYGALQLGREMIERSHPPARAVIEAMRGHLAAGAPDGQIDYVALVNSQTLEDVETTDGPVALALAVRLGRARLIDNVVVE